MRLAARCSLLFVIALSPLASAASLPSLTVQDDNGAVALSIEALRVDVMIRGHLARTTYEITYRNSTDRVVDGDFSFPLPPDAEVSDIALYFGQTLRHAVAVERVQAKTAYEDTVHRRRVDPALAEWSSSSRAFHFHVYPIPALDTKLVHISYDQELTSSPYELDLRYGANVKSFDLNIEGDARIDADGLVLHNGSAQLQNAKLDAVIRAAASDDERALVAFSPSDKTWYASARLRLHSTSRAIDPASDVTLLYDASGSAVQRDQEKLRAFLAAFFAKQSASMRVTVVPFHVAVDAARETDAQGVERTLATIPLAGATNLAAAIESISSARPSSRIVIVTDGINDLGDSSRVARAISAAAALRRPLTIVNASPTGDDNLLGGLARASGGWYVDLAHADPIAAAESAMRLPTRIKLESGTPLIRDVLPSALLATTDLVTTVNARSRIQFSTLPVIAGNARRDFAVRYLDSEEEQDLVRRAWARARLRALLDGGAPPETLLEHGRHFGQLTPQTSLLVLETWQDYVMWGFPLPADLRAERAVSEEEDRRREREQQRPGTIELRGRTNEPSPQGAAWFIKGTVTLSESPLPGATLTMSTPDMSRTTVSDGEGRFWFNLPAAPQSFMLKAEMESFSTTTRSFPRGAPKGSIVEIEMRLSAVAEAITVTAAGPVVEADTTQINQPRNASLARRDANALADRLLGALASEDVAAIDDEETAAKTIGQRVERIAAVVEKLRSLNSIDDRFRYYAAARSVLGGEKLFQAQAALAVRDDAPDLAIRLLTDLVEAYPDDAPTLRIIGRVLAGWGRADLAALLFERAIELSPRETQSWRELILLHAKEGHERELSELQRRYASYQRDARMAQTETALAEEMKRRTTGTDPRLDPSSELQIEAMWDSNYTDVDMHVIEPDGEQVYYGHRDSKSGGRLHDDVTTGFGPEIYTAPHVQKGTYQIVLATYAADMTRVMQETLAHVIVWTRGERHDFFVALTVRDDKRVVATVTEDGR